MSRLQVGGLALIVNDTELENIGKVVKLVGFHGNSMRGRFSMSIVHDGWNVSCDDGLMFPDGILRNAIGLISSKNLMPLGDQKTQDEFRKEELENV